MCKEAPYQRISSWERWLKTSWKCFLRTLPFDPMSIYAHIHISTYIHIYLSLVHFFLSTSSSPLSYLVWVFSVTLFHTALFRTLDVTMEKKTFFLFFLSFGFCFLFWCLSLFLWLFVWWFVLQSGVQELSLLLLLLQFPHILLMGRRKQTLMVALSGVRRSTVPLLPTIESVKEGDMVGLER